MNQPQSQVFSPEFSTTRWSVLRQRDASQTQVASAALEGLRRAYRYPIHACLRRSSHTPETLFELSWAREVMARSLNALEREYARSGRGRAFDLLKPCLYRDTDAQSYASIALEPGKSGDSIKTGVHRQRQCFQQCLRAQLIETVAESAQVEEELSQLRQFLQRDGTGCSPAPWKRGNIFSFCPPGLRRISSCLQWPDGVPHLEHDRQAHLLFRQQRHDQGGAGSH